MQTKMTVRYHFISTRITSVRKVVDKLAPSYTAARDVAWCSYFGRKCGASSKE